MLLLWLSLKCLPFVHSKHNINLTELFFTVSTSETKAAVHQNDTGHLATLKKKAKKRRLKEDVSLWEERRRCSDGENDKSEAMEPPSKKDTTDDRNISKQGAGM